MRTAWLLTALLLSAVSLIGRPHAWPRYRPPARPASHVTSVSWKAIAAGGAAVSGAVFAYKVGDGIQKGTLEVARAHPEVFATATDDLTGVIAVASGISALLLVAYLIWLLLSRGRKPPAD